MIRINPICMILLILTLLDFGIASSLADVGGIWKICGFGANIMALTQSMNHVYGTYTTSQGQGTIDGFVDPQNVWTGTWYEPFNDDWGYFSATFSNDTSQLNGGWKYASSDYDVHDTYMPFSGYWDGPFQGVKLQTNITTNTSIN